MSIHCRFSQHQPDTNGQIRNGTRDVRRRLVGAETGEIERATRSPAKANNPCWPAAPIRCSHSYNWFAGDRCSRLGATERPSRSCAGSFEPTEPPYQPWAGVWVVSGLAEAAAQSGMESQARALLQPLGRSSSRPRAATSVPGRLRRRGCSWLRGPGFGATAKSPPPGRPCASPATASKASAPDRGPSVRCKSFARPASLRDDEASTFAWS
jgi:hypothetical protein